MKLEGILTTQPSAASFIARDDLSIASRITGPGGEVETTLYRAQPSNELRVDIAVHGASLDLSYASFERLIRDLVGTGQAQVPCEHPNMEVMAFCDVVQTMSAGPGGITGTNADGWEETPQGIEPRVYGFHCPDCHTWWKARQERTEDGSKLTGNIAPADESCTLWDLQWAQMLDKFMVCEHFEPDKIEGFPWTADYHNINELIEALSHVRERK
jgi:hypothetical protein